MRPCFTDLDYDGLYDLIIGDRDGSLEHLEQSSPGSSYFTSLTKNFNNINLGTSSDPAPRIKDIDNNGLLDLLIGNSSGTLLHYEQAEQESAAFILISDSFNDIDVGKISTPSFTDLDRDGLIDLIVGEEDGYLNHFEQDTGKYSQFLLITDRFAGIHIGNDTKPTFGDVNGDGLDDIFIGEGDGGILYFQRDKKTGVSIQKTDHVSQRVFELKPNYPNPFNPITDIMFFMHVKAEIELSILDATGKRIETLFHGQAEPGEHQIAWNASGYAAGIYLIKLSSHEHNSIRRCLFLK